MSTVELVVLLIPIAAGIQTLAAWLKIPSPTVLVLGGLALAFVPQLPRSVLDPNVVFLTFIPPLLFYGAVTAPWRQFRLRTWPIVSLSVFLVLATMAAVAVVAHGLNPVFTWAAAFTLGAIVSPPDPIAAIAVTRSLDVSRGIEGVLEGEGLANDATALVAYSVAVGAAMTGTFSPGAAAAKLVLAVVMGIGVGWVTGYVTCWLFRKVMRTPVSQNALTLIVPFVSYVAADRLGASGVLAVVTVGLVLGRQGARVYTAEVRLQFESLWTMINYVLESMIFIFVGLELPVVVRGLHDQALWELIGMAAVISVVCVVVRLLWVFPSARFTRRSDLDLPEMAGTVWRQVAFVGWAGMRGADSLVIALALPTMTSAGTPFPARAGIIVITFGVILATLVVQGFSMGWVARRLGLVGVSAREDVVQEGTAWIAAAEAGLSAIDELAHTAEAQSEPTRRTLVRMAELYRRRRRQWRGRIAAGTETLDRRLDAERRVELVLADHEREAVQRLRDEGTIDDAISRHVERYVDLETLLASYPALDVDDSPFEATE